MVSSSRISKCVALLLIVLLFFVYFTPSTRRDEVDLKLEKLLLHDESALVLDQLKPSFIMENFKKEKPIVFGTLSDGEIGLIRTFVAIYGARLVGNIQPWVIFVPQVAGTHISFSSNVKSLCDFLGAKIIVMDWIDLPDNFHPGQPNWEFSWQKMNIWKYEQFEKVVLVDADTFFQRSANEMIDFKDFSYSSGTCDRPCHEYFWEMNAGVVVLKPNITFYHELIDYGKTHDSPSKYRLVEQDLLWLFYQQNRERPSYRMSNLYNMCILWCDSKCFPDPAFEDLVIIAHFVCTDYKPWDFSKNDWGTRGCAGRYALKWFERLDSLAKLLGVKREEK